ncbi:MAG: IS4 family transposase [Prevotella sp.]|nr:IS4 family transposase [Prevotella sp.]MCH4099650.1 IS4 family transposase [Prevotella sp.]MCI1519053.1 IS4 family transposase [Prevotella sp.]MCI1548433.1 IS4 family transposase [Prevotella sp.]MCI1685033.1 IS4 family transposase [Prevotella sp.]MCI1782004.1 IS4 family transposase [Prevotella sp.]
MHISFSDRKFLSLDLVFILFRLAMPNGKTVFAQIMDIVPDYELRKCIEIYSADKGMKKFSCRDQFKVMSFAQFTGCSSLRLVDATLTAFGYKLYHSEMKLMHKSTLAEMNEKKPWLIYHDFAQILIERAHKLYKNDYFRLGLDEMVYAFDSSTIELCLQLCPWARFHHGKGAFKMHTMLDIRGSIPTFVWLTEAAVNDVNALDIMPVEAGSIYLMDKGYVDFWRLFNRIHQQGAFFVTRAKNNMKYKVEGSREVNKTAGLISDENIRLTGPIVSLDYPDLMRLVTYEDYDTNNVYQFLTNNFTHEAITIAELYRERWNVELFFKWIKQHLHIKSFFGTNQNAIFTQIWIAVCDYLLLLIARKVYHINQELYIFSKAIGLVLFEVIPLADLFNQFDESKLEPGDDGQLWLFEE